MKRMILFLAMLTTCACVMGQTLSPVVIATAGNYSGGESLSLSWTMGETAVTTLENGDFLLTQGFQQPWKLATGIAVPQAAWENRVWPNPVTTRVHIEFNMEKAGMYILTLTDLTGRRTVIATTRMIFPGEQITLDMSRCTPGMYLLRITTEEKKSFRIYKLIRK